MKKRKANIIYSSSDDDSSSKIQKTLVAEINSDENDLSNVHIIDKPGSSDLKDTTLWIDKYAPCIPTDLAVHKKKIEQIMSWMATLNDMMPKV